MIFQAASDGDPALLKRRVMMLDMGRGRLKEAVEGLRVEDVGMLEGLGVLHVAACRGRLEVCRYLIEELVLDVNGVDKGGRTPLFLRYHVRVWVLPDIFLIMDKASHDGLSPLHSTVGSGDCETVELLLAKGAYVDPIAFCGPLLHCAATEGHDGTVKILLDHNADYNKMVNGKTPLIAAINGASIECMRLLVKDDPVERRRIRAAGFKSLGSQASKAKQYLSAAGSYSVAIKFAPGDATSF